MRQGFAAAVDHAHQVHTDDALPVLIALLGDRRGFAGDAYNTAVYLKRSAPDVEVSFLTATGDESLSDAMVATWRSEGISDRLV